MKQFYSEIENLKLEVEKRIGRHLKTPVDFDFLSYKVSTEINEQLSVSTIKRLWGYVPTSHIPSLATLSILTRFVGYKDWDSFCAILKQGINIESSFFSNKRILTTDLCIGDLLEIGWNPNRYCVLKFLGNSQFSVIESQNAKIKVGDMFTTEQFHLNQPLIITDLRQKGVSQTNGELMSYIAGYQTGLTLLNLTK